MQLSISNRGNEGQANETWLSLLWQSWAMTTFHTGLSGNLQLALCNGLWGLTEALLLLVDNLNEIK